MQFLRITLVAALASNVLMALISRRSLNVAYYATFTRLSGVLLGAALAMVYAPYLLRGRPAKSVRPVLDIVGVAGLVVLWLSFRNFHFTKTSGVWTGGFLLVGVATIFVIAAVVHPASDMGRILGVRPLQWVGRRSYGVYLWHYPVFAITRPGLDHGHFWNLRGVPCFALRLALTLVLAALSYHYVEAPIHNGAIAEYVSRLRARRPVRVAGGSRFPASRSRPAS